MPYYNAENNIHLRFTTLFSLVVHFAIGQNKQVRKTMKRFFKIEKIKDILSLLPKREGRFCIGLNFEFVLLQPGRWWDVSEIPMSCAYPRQKEQNKVLR